MEQLQTTTNQYHQNEFDERIIYALVSRAYRDLKPEGETKEISITREAIDLSLNLSKRFIYQDQTLVEKMAKLIDNIGSRLFNQLNDDQKILMAKTAGLIEFKRKIDINSVYDYIETYEL